jgi:hypothetical protein
MFETRWCDGAKKRLPTREAMEFFFPPDYDPKTWRRKRYESRERGRLRAGHPN